MGTQRVLITGGAGFIGGKLANLLVSKGFHVEILDNFSPQIHGDDLSAAKEDFLNTHPGCSVTVADVRNAVDTGEAVKRANYIVHLAAETGTGQSMYEISRYVDVNVAGTATLLEQITSNSEHLKRIVVASSRAVYGEGDYADRASTRTSPAERDEADLRRGMFDFTSSSGESLRPIPTREDSPTLPLSIYGATKLSQEQLILIGAAAASVPAIALRFQNVYGPGQSLNNPYTGILSIFSTLILTNRTVSIFEDGEESRDFVFVDDVVNSIYLALVADKKVNGVFNIGSGVRTSVNEVSRILHELYGMADNSAITGQYRVGDIRHNFADLSRAKEVLGYEPEVDFAAGITAFAQWVRQQNIVESRFDSSMSELRHRGLIK